MRALIKRKELTLDQFASRYGMAESQLHNWLKRDDPPLAKHWDKLAEFFGVDRSYIIGASATENMERVSDVPQAAYDTAEGLRGEIRKRVEEAIQAAGDDLAKLGWLCEQAVRHMSASEHWETPEKVIARLKTEEDRKDEEALAAVDRAHSARPHGKAS